MSGATTRHRAVTLGVLAAVLVGTAASTSGRRRPIRIPAVRDLDLAASANPSAAEPVVADDAFASDAVSRRRTVKSDVTATGSAICDGCDATSTALQVLYVSRVQRGSPRQHRRRVDAGLRGLHRDGAIGAGGRPPGRAGDRAEQPGPRRQRRVHVVPGGRRRVPTGGELPSTTDSPPMRWLRCGHGWPSRLQRCGRRRRPRTRQGPTDGSTGRRPNGVPRELPTPRWWISRTWSPAIWAPRPSPPTSSSAADRTSA